MVRLLPLARFTLSSLFALALLCPILRAQEIQLYSEFQRFNPFGTPVAQDLDLSPREIISPAVPRNGHLTLHAVVTAPAGTNYFVYLASNPAGILDLHLYREHYSRCGIEFCPDWLTELRPPVFGAMPESRERMPGQTTRSYLLDIYVPKDVPPRRVRVEVLLKVGIWMVAPMEVRVISPTVPDIDIRGDAGIAPEAPSSDFALQQMLRFEAGQPPQLPRTYTRVQDFIQRNAAEDFALAALLRPRFWMPLRMEDHGAEWYLRVRDLIYRRSVAAW